jgi:hypothetical protein
VILPLADKAGNGKKAPVVAKIKVHVLLIDFIDKSIPGCKLPKKWKSSFSVNLNIQAV